MSQNDSQLRGSRERPKARSFSATPARGVTGKIALLLRRRLDSWVRRAENIATRLFDGEGSFSPRMTALPSDDIAMRSALLPLGGDGVNSSALCTMASPSNDIDNLRDGGDFVGVEGVVRLFSGCPPPAPLISDAERFLFGTDNREPSEEGFTFWENSSCVVGGVSSTTSVATLV